ncbi:MAG TPA: hypothetical protein PKD64_01605 [Pirellulaceae bacterium]|nr:hypothetical protein [Pirellulaceae bacterium]HMO90865.1 hypothetical protein [Pirellulaceae bacterium]HMP68659.1 hypothetical protein [Pirellulaceae bacterium]
MEARNLVRALCVLSLVLVCRAGFTADYATTNFTVRAPDVRLARQVGDLAEKYRKELALHWLGYELPNWEQRCPITVEIKQHAGGETSFVFYPDGPNGRSAPAQWRMLIFGSVERILDSVLPHEVTHTIFATHFGRPLPRWADEGACTTVEHESEKDKNHRMLIDFLKTKRGIPFNHMFAMKQYPSDILPLYAQGHSLVRFLLLHNSPRHFVDYIDAGMKRESSQHVAESWDRTTKEFYGYENLSELQLAWLNWVKEGSKSNIVALNARENPSDRLASKTNDVLPPNPDSVMPPRNLADSFVNAGDHLDQVDNRQFSQVQSTPLQSTPPSENFYVQQMRTGQPSQASVGQSYKPYREQSHIVSNTKHDTHGELEQKSISNLADSTNSSNCETNANGIVFQGEITRLYQNGRSIWR